MTQGDDRPLERKILARRNNVITQALREQLDLIDPYDEHKRTHAQIIAGKMIEMATAGDHHFTKEILDRVEGKVRQPIEFSLADELIDLVNTHGIDPSSDPILSAVFVAAGLAQASDPADEAADRGDGARSLTDVTVG